MKVAIVHDWLTVYAGAEKVLEQMLACWPDADLFSLVDFLPEDIMDQLTRDHLLPPIQVGV